MKKLIFCFVVAFSLVGCAKTVLVHDTKSPADLEKDKYECMNIATQQAANLGAAGNPFVIKDQTLMCLTMKYGWRVQS
ncbi:hypothetical protein J8628_03075 [Serratia fonticola]|uniref:hypothetical protein n=1 Tax=Serratia fonticola TaxID=47917 RepID=UPI001AE6D4F0|nr:hypothetical protein [Serratia fonticola]MBP1015889.1 hypothetical protein [Serratia fonticola]